MPTPEKYPFFSPVLYKGMECTITGRGGQPSLAYQKKHKFFKPQMYYNLREKLSGKIHEDIPHSDLMPMHIALDHDRERHVMEKAD